MKLLLKNGTVIDPATNKNGLFDVLIDGKKIKAIEKKILYKNAQIIDVKGMVIAPGLVDAHVHFREPGFEHKETIETGSWAAAAGGFTAVIMEPNTSPPIDSPSRISKVLNIIKKNSIINVYTKACITKGLKGERLGNIEALKDAGAVAISDDGNPVYGKKIMHNAFQKSILAGIPVSPHCEESHLYREKFKAKLKKKTHLLINTNKFFKQPYSSEAEFIERDIELAKKTGAKLHISHVSFAKSVKLIANAKNEGVNVTAEVAPHHLILTEKNAKTLGTNAKVCPPLRTKRDVDALNEGLINGAIDIIASDHAPHSEKEKALPWKSRGKEAPFGMIGIETTLALVLTFLVKPGLLTMYQAINKLSTLPAKIFGLEAGSLALGSKADITIIDPEKKWTIDASKFYSKSRNCPFDGWEVQGKAIMTIIGGRIIMKEGEIIKDRVDTLSSKKIIS